MQEEEKNWQCEEILRLALAVSQDGSIIQIVLDQVSDKGLHIPNFVEETSLKGKFDMTEVKDLEYNERLEYLRDKSNLLDENMHET